MIHLLHDYLKLMQHLSLIISLTGRVIHSMFLPSKKNVSATPMTQYYLKGGRLYCPFSAASGNQLDELADVLHCFQAIYHFDNLFDNTLGQGFQ